MAGCVISGMLCGFSRNNPWYFVCFWCLQMFFSSGVWGGVANVIRESYDESAYGRCFSLLGFFSRLGATIGALCMTPILHTGKWQYVFLAGFAIPASLGTACLVQLHVMLQTGKGWRGLQDNRDDRDNSANGTANPLSQPLLGGAKAEDVHYVSAVTITTKTANTAPGSDDTEAAAGAVASAASLKPAQEKDALWAFIVKCLYEPRVYAVLVNSIVLTVMMELQFMVPVFLQEQFHVSSALGGYGAAFFIGGCLFTPFVGAKYDVWSWKRRSQMLPTLVLFAATMMVPLVLLPPLMHGMSPTLTVVVAGLVLMFVSAGVCGPYYITGSEFAMLMGGQEFAGFFLNSIDALSYIVAVGFDVGGYKYAAAHGWSAVILTLLAASVVDAGALAYYYRLPKLSTLKDK